MSILSNINTSDQTEAPRDSLGGGGPLETGVYPATIRAVYFQTAESGALAANVHFDIDGREHRERLWFVSGNAKGNRTFYERDGKKFELPSYTTFKDLTLMTVGKLPNEIDTEDGVMNIYSPEASKEVPTTVPMAKELVGKSIRLGLEKQIVDKTQRNDEGKYVPTGETREQNEIVKLFHGETGMTVVEAQAGLTEGAFIKDWETKFAGVTRDKTTKDIGNTPARAVSGVASPATTQPKKSMFG